MATELDDAVTVLIDAVRRHAAAVAGGDAQGRRKAGPALVQALHDYGAAVWKAGADAPEELGEFDEWLDDEDGIEHPVPEPDVRQRIALFTRTDLAVTDLALLRSSAAERLADCCGNVFEDVDAAVARPVDAINHLVGHGPTSLQPENWEGFGLDLLSGACTTVEVGDVDGARDVAIDDPWAPLREAVED